MTSKIQRILSAATVEYIHNNHVSFQQVKALNAIGSCRTKNMGTHSLSCSCGHMKTINNSCGNRHCPVCGSFKKELWVMKQQESLLPSHYFHLVFTLPDTLNSFIYFNQKELYSLMYQAASKTLLELSADKFGVTPGFTLVLHTWGQNLGYHPHLHCILAGGGLSLDQTHFKTFKKKFFIHIKILSALFKGKFLHGFKELLTQGSLYSPNNLQDTLTSFLDDLYSKDWVVFSRPVFKCAAHVIKYLARYTHRVAISDHRIISVTDTQVSFNYLDNRDGKKKSLTLSQEEFVHRFLMHILPHKFVKIRHYGFLSNRFRSEKVALCRKLIARQKGVKLIFPKLPDKLTLLEALIGKENLCCPKCGRYFTYNHEVCLT
jgi:hypothetical protein